MDCPPNVAGKWKVVEYKVVDGINTINNPQKIEFEATLRQNGRFVDSDSSSIIFYGVWKYLGDKKWEFVQVSNDSDNDTFNFTPLCQKCNKVTKMDYINYEAGNIPSEPRQVAKVAYGTWYRIA